MVTAQEFIYAQLNRLRRMQQVLCLAQSSAASHGLKSDIKDQITELDGLENHFLSLAIRRGWEYREPSSVSRILATFSFRCRKDADIAEHLICLYHRDRIELMKLYNRWDRADTAMQVLFQKYTDQSTAGIRRMEDYL